MKASGGRLPLLLVGLPTVLLLPRRPRLAALAALAVLLLQGVHDPLIHPLVATLAAVELQALGREDVADHLQGLQLLRLLAPTVVQLQERFDGERLDELED